MIYISLSEDDTKNIARYFANKSKPGDIICLDGELGSGKTVFVKEFAKTLGVKEHVSSPTFNIINEYHGTVDLYHFDVYRISDISEMEYTNYEDYFYGSGICLIEWAENIKGIIPQSARWIKFRRKDFCDENYRIMELV